MSDSLLINSAGGELKKEPETKKDPLQLLRGDGFIKFTDTLIKLVEKRGIQPRNGAFLICKMPFENITEGGILLAKEASDFFERTTGYGRVISVPKDLEGTHNADIQPGMFVFYNRAGHYVVNEPVVRLALGIKDFPEGYLVSVLDNEVFFSVKNSDTGLRI